MFLTANQNQLPTLAGDGLRAWPAVELEFDEPVFLCSWSDESTFDAVRGTALVLLERDLRQWIQRRSPGPTLRCLQMLMPTEYGWQAHDISSVWDERDAGLGRILIFEDMRGEFRSLWTGADALKPGSVPVWRSRARTTEHRDVRPRQSTRRGKPRKPSNHENE